MKRRGRGRHPPFPLLPRQRLFDSFSSFAFIRRPTETRPQGTKERNGIRQYLARYTLTNLNMQELPYVSKSSQKLTNFWSKLSGMLAQTVDSPLASLFAWSSGKGIPSPSPFSPFSCREDDAKEEKGADKVASSPLLLLLQLFWTSCFSPLFPPKKVASHSYL